VAHYAPFVVVHVSVAASGAFDLFDHSVEAFGSGVRDAHFQEDQDCWPPCLDGLGQLDRFNGPGIGASVVELKSSLANWPLIVATGQEFS
jgi:hypothetical protein